MTFSVGLIGSNWETAQPNYTPIGSGGDVASVFGRVGIVVAEDGDYSGIVASAKTGATAATRYVGGTTGGAPNTGTFDVGDFIIDQTGSVWICSVAGSPGTWVQAGGGSGTINRITSTGGTILVSSPTGPTTNIEAVSTVTLNPYVIAPGVGGIKGDLIELYAGAISGASHNFTDATANFSAGDVGKIIVVVGAGTSSVSSLQTTIATVVDATHVTLTAAAGTTVSGATWYYGTDDSLAIQAVIDAASLAASAVGVVGVAPRALVQWYGPHGYMLTYGQGNAVGPEAGVKTAVFMRQFVEVVGVGRPWLFANQVGQHVGGQIAFTILGSYPLPSQYNFPNPPILGGNPDQTPINNWKISGLFIDGGFRPNQNHSGVAFPDATEDFFGIGVGCGQNYEITDNWIVGIWGDVIRLGDIYAGDVLIHGNYITVFNGQAVEISRANPATYPALANVNLQQVVSDNIIFDNQAGAGGSSETIEVESTTGRTTISGNSIVKCGAINAAGYGVTVTGNYTAPDPGVSGAIELGSQCVATGNVIDLALNGLSSGANGVIGSGDCVVADNVIYIAGGSGTNPSGISLTGTGNVITGNKILALATTTTQSGTDIIGAADNIIEGNLCLACANSIYLGGTTMNPASGIIKGNNCRGRISVGSGGVNSALIEGNKCAVTVGGSGQVSPAYDIGPGGNTFRGNTIDATLSTNSGPAIFFSGGSYVANLFQNETFLGASGVNLMGGSPFSGLTDVFDNCVLTGGGVFNLQSGQTYKRTGGALHALTFPGSGGAVSTDASLGSLVSLAVTDSTGFTISNPTNSVAGMTITYDILNSSGGAMGTATWASAFKLDATGFVNPANGKQKTISFFYNGTNWIQNGPTSADI